MVTGKFISLNTRGISNYRKQRAIFTWLRKQKSDIASFRKHTLPKGMKFLAKRMGCHTNPALMGLIMQEVSQF